MVLRRTELTRNIGRDRLQLSLGQLLVLAAVVFGIAVAPARMAFAAPGDKEETAVLAALEKVLADDVASANFGEARKKLKALFDRCKKAKCSEQTMAQLHAGNAATLAQMNKLVDARAAFREALAANGSVKTPDGIPEAAKTAFADERRDWVRTHPLGDDSVKGGWSSTAAFEAAKEAATAFADRKWDECVEKASRSLTLEDHPRTRLIFTRCEAKTSRLVNALRSAVAAKESADKRNDAQTSKEAEAEIQDLIGRLPRISFEMPPEAKETTVTIDDKPIPSEKLKKGVVVDPGTHAVRAEATLRATRMSFEERVEAKEGENTKVVVKLTPAALTQGQLECMVAAANQAEVLKCLPDDSKPLLVRISSDVSAYDDTLAVRVLSPGVRGSVSSPTSGWSAGAGYTLDMVSAASPDVVAQASPRFTDTRHVVNVNGAYKPGSIGGSLFGNVSSESDYVSRTIGGALTSDFMDKQITANLGVSLSFDTMGRAGTPYDVYSQSLTTKDIQLSVSIVMDPRSVLLLGTNVILEDGNQSKPYRYVPMFGPGVLLPVGASVDEVNAKRLASKPLEQLPTDRQRYSVGGRYVRKMSPNQTLRIEERVYADSWVTFASTTDFRYLVDVSSRLRVWPHAHLHAQNGTVFYQRIYGATLQPDGSALLPVYRTTDRELSPMIGLTGGGGARLQVTDDNAKVGFALVASVDVLYNQYFNSLYLTNRLGSWATLGVEANFE